MNTKIIALLITVISSNFMAKEASAGFGKWIKKEVIGTVNGTHKPGYIQVLL